jgi:hypothetical protein
MARIDGVDPDWAEKPLRAVFEAQAKKWGAPLSNHLICQTSEHFPSGAGYVERVGFVGSRRSQARHSH